MLLLSKYPFKTLKSVPKISDNRSTSLLLQAGYIRQEMAGAYIFLNFGLRVLNKIANIVREELDNIGSAEILMTTLGTKDHRMQTGRWDSLDILFKTLGAGNKEYAVNSTHEEVVTPLMQEFIQSYKDLINCSVYQIQTKFRNEARAKSGLLRGREFLMKDMYSFHANEKDFDEYYELSKVAYLKIFERLGLGDCTNITIADGGSFTDKFSHEFQTILDIGEDTIAMDSSGYCANVEVAEGIPDNKNLDEEEKKLEYIEASGVLTVDDMVKFFKCPKWQILKTVVYKDETGQLFGIVVRGDLDVNEIKVRKFIHQKFMQATEEDLEKLETARGFVSPVTQDNYKGIIFYGDNSLKTVKNFIGGGKKKDLDLKNINLKDMCIKEFGDFANVAPGFLSKNTGEKLEFKKACEVGNIFPLMTKFSNAFGLKYLDGNGKTQDILMGCYGIGVSRVMGVIAEKFMDEKGLIWPENIAPYDYYMIVMGDNLQKAKELAIKLEKEGKSVIIDDRDAGFGQKAGDFDLLGIPYRIVISDKTLISDSYELKSRKSDEVNLVSF
ncbi:MAG: proline--tRNA ligase [Candidatus Gracilibacteria bacterium]|nr:proline--tRNA ligase [Candidatus Gracilibacteria bacterium]